MTSRDNASTDITPEVLLRAYACGIFPMAESADDPTLFWDEPEVRGVSVGVDVGFAADKLSRGIAAGAETVSGSAIVSVAKVGASGTGASGVAAPAKATGGEEARIWLGTWKYWAAPPRS